MILELTGEDMMFSLFSQLQEKVATYSVGRKTGCRC